MQIGPILRAVGNVQLMSSVAVLPSLGIALWNDDGTAKFFLESFGILLVIGLALFLATRGATGELRMRDGFLVTVLVWLITSLVLAIPLVLAPPNLSYTDAVFEVVSGLTTTGATMIVGLDQLPQSVLFYRQFLHFYGGMGIVILAVAILPSLRVGGIQLTKGETTGPVKDSKLTPRIAQTAAALWLIYVGLNVLCTTAYWLAGMSFFDAVTHSMATLATGGFGNYDASMAHFNSVSIELIAIVFMLLGGASFGLHYLAWQRGSMTPLARDPEVRWFLAIVFGVALVVALQIWLGGRFPSFIESFRHSLFHVVSNITTTGFVTTGFADWPGMAAAALMLVGFVGGCAGSTSGAIKVVRVVITAKLALREIHRLIHPRARFLVKIGGSPVPDEVIGAVAGFVTVYIATFVVLSLGVAATGVDLVSAFSAVAACLNNMGPGLGVVAAHFRDLSEVAVWMCTLAMLIGRLEVFTLLVVLTPAFWRE